MAIRTYRGRTPGEALAQVKRELGADAVILHTRTSKGGGVWGLGGRAWTEITATSGKGSGRGKGAATSGRAREGGKASARAAGGRDAVMRAGAACVGAGVGPEGGEARGREWDVKRLDVVELVGAAGKASERVELEGASAGTGRAPGRGDEGRGEGNDLFSGLEGRGVGGADDPLRGVARSVAGGAGLCDGGGRSVEQEIALIRRMVGQVLQTSRGASGVGVMPRALEECYVRLLEAEVASEIADDVMGRVRDELTPQELADQSVVRETVLRRLASLIPVQDEPVSTARPADGRPRTIALVGPTGVGKTTTIAKLAATYKLRLRKRVGLVTSDTYRIAAVDQLRTYANIIGLPLEVTLTPTEMSRAVRRLSECDVILIDTAGRSQHDANRVEELRAFIEAARPHETHLVLSSTVGESVLRRTASAFAAVRPTHMIFTKLDEAVNFGVLVNVIRSVDARLSFVTTGQEVPDQIERGNADRLARLVLDGGR